MASMKFKDIKGMSNQEKEKKLKELKLELIRSRANSSKTGNSKAKEIKKIISRILNSNK